MPTYEYACSKCGHKFEEFQSITSKPLKKCPSCGKNTLKRLLGTGAGIIFKGSGFYATDYRSDSYTQSKKQEEGSGSTATKSGGDTPAKKTESTAKSEAKESTPSAPAKASAAKSDSLKSKK